MGEDEYLWEKMNILTNNMTNSMMYNMMYNVGT